MAEIVMPQLGESVTEGTIARWLKQPGDHVERYEAIAEVVTDKVNAEIPAPSDGIMGKHLVEEGAVVPVGAAICEIDPGDGAGAGAEAEQPAAVGGGATGAAEASTAPPAQGSAPPAQEAAEPAQEPASQQEPAAQPEPAPEQPQQPTAAPPPPAAAEQPAAQAGAAVEPSQDGANGADLHVTPAVRMLAREHGIDLAKVTGSGVGGRITKKDVLTYVQQQGSRPVAAAPAQPAAAPSQPQPGTPAQQPAAAQAGVPQHLSGDTLVPLTQARRAIAEHMVRSKATSPHAWTMVEVDMTRVVRVRNREKRAFEQATGAHLTFLPFVARATIASLRKFPTMNATFTADGILVRHDIHLGIAVALEDSLIVPVIRNADSLSITGLAQTARDLGERARAGKLRIDELTGGTFTLNNTGALGLVLTMPIINQPQAAILAMDAIVKRPVVTEDDAIAIRSMMSLSFSFDHRLVDGLAAARFIRDVKEQLESIDESASVL
jgi:2-oxoisovalerate dehydrogenase E2 component (dihydrolipoyl transacylase)